MTDLVIFGLPWWAFALMFGTLFSIVIIIGAVIYFKYIKKDEVFLPRDVELQDSISTAKTLKPQHINTVVLCGDSTHPSKVLGKCIGFNPQPFTGRIPAKDGETDYEIQVDTGKGDVETKTIKVLSKKQMKEQGFAILNDVVFKPNLFTTEIIRVFDASIMDKEYNPLTKKFEFIPPVGIIEIKAVGFRKRGGFLFPNHYFDDDDIMLGHEANRTMAIAFERYSDVIGKITDKAVKADEDYIRRMNQRQFTIKGPKPNQNQGGNQS